MFYSLNKTLIYHFWTECCTVTVLLLHCYCTVTALLLYCYCTVTALLLHC